MITTASIAARLRTNLKKGGISVFAALAFVAAAVFASAVPAAAQFRANNINIGPRTSPMMTNIGPRSPGFDRPRGPRGGVVITIPPGGGGYIDPPPPQRPIVIETNKKPAKKTTARRSNAPGPNERRFVPDEVILEFAGNPSPQAVERFANSFRLTRLESQFFALTNTTMYRWRIPDPSRRTVANVIRALEGNAQIRFASANYLYDLAQATTASAPANTTEGDPAQYTLSKLQLPLAHHLAKGEQVLVAVIDSAIDTAHPELAGVVVDSFDPLKAGEPHSHGTAIAGAIASHARLMGVAPSARVLAVSAFGRADTGAQGTTFNILKGLDWAVSKGARVVNMSFAGPQDPGLTRGLAAAKQKGVVLIAASGNAGPKSPPLYPAADPNVIAVTATDAQDNLFEGSNRGPYINVAAPGVDILLPSPGAGYQVSTGTSFAAAHISGVVALMLEKQPDLSPDAVRKILMDTARDLGAKGRDPLYGAGLADAYSAVKAAETLGASAQAAPAAATKAAVR